MKLCYGWDQQPLLTMIVKLTHQYSIGGAAIVKGKKISHIEILFNIIFPILYHKIWLPYFKNIT